MVHTRPRRQTSTEMYTYINMMHTYPTQTHLLQIVCQYKSVKWNTGIKLIILVNRLYVLNIYFRYYSFYISIPNCQYENKSPLYIFQKRKYFSSIHISPIFHKSNTFCQKVSRLNNVKIRIFLYVSYINQGIYDIFEEETLLTCPNLSLKLIDVNAFV